MVSCPTILQMWTNVALVTMCVDRRTVCAKMSQDHSSASVNKARLEMETNVKVLIELMITYMHHFKECQWNLRSGKWFYKLPHGPFETSHLILKSWKDFWELYYVLLQRKNLESKEKKVWKIDPLPSRSTRSLCKRTSFGNTVNSLSRTPLGPVLSVCLREMSVL